MPWYRIVQFLIMALGMTAGAIRFKLLSKSSKWAWSLLIITFVNEFTAWYLSQALRGNYILSYFFIPVQFGCLAGAFAQELRSMHRLILICALLLVILSGIYVVTSFDILQKYYPTTLRTIANLLIISMSLLWFRRLLETVQDFSFTEYPLFWLSLGWLLFSIITLFNFSAFNYITDSAQQAELLFKYVRIAANFMLYSMFIFAFLSRQREVDELVPYGK